MPRRREQFRQAQVAGFRGTQSFDINSIVWGVGCAEYDAQRGAKGLRAFAQSRLSVGLGGVGNKLASRKITGISFSDFLITLNVAVVDTRVPSCDASNS